MARVFAVIVGVSWAIRVSRYKVDKWPVNCLGSRRFVDGHRRSVAVGIVSELGICHVSRNSIAGRCASPGVASITNLSW